MQTNNVFVFVLSTLLILGTNATPTPQDSVLPISETTDNNIAATGNSTTDGGAKCATGEVNGFKISDCDSSLEELTKTAPTTKESIVTTSSGSCETLLISDDQSRIVITEEVASTNFGPKGSAIKLIQETCASKPGNVTLTGLNQSGGNLTVVLRQAQNAN